MHCAKCNYDNPADASFCEGCGAKLELICPTCKAPLSPGARFCKKCGTAIGPTTADASATPSSAKSQISVAADSGASEASDGERKTVTLLFADIKGSMELMEDLDPEEARAIVDPALKLMIDAAHRYDGYIVQSTGDGIFALFGAPVAHEDHPQRALLAALRMQEELRRYGSTLQAEGRAPIEIRVGVSTGEVVVRAIETGAGQVEYTPIGHTVGLASRLQSIARTGSIVVSEATRRFCEGYFHLKALGPTRVKGVSEPVAVYEVTGLGPLRTRLQGSAARGYTKFVGRQREMQALRHAAEQAKSGHGQIVAAMAEPGVGKSRLFFEFKATSLSGWMVLEAFSVSHGKASAYLPVIELLRSYFKITADDDDRTRREKVNGRIVTLDRSLEDALPYLFGLLGIVEGDDPLAQMSAEIRRRRTQEAIKRILLRESLKQPLILVFEDLHWIDAETQALLDLLVEAIAGSRILLLVNYRPEYRHQWSGKTYYTQLRLDPLAPESASELLAALLGDGNDLTPLKRLIIDKTEGNPFFIEEMVQAMFEQGALTRNGTVKLARSLNSIRIPTAVQAVLVSRIDRLPAPEKALLQTMAVVGTEFSAALLSEVVDFPREELDRMLWELQLAEFIYEQPASGDVEYRFKHALTHEVAYNSVLIERRKSLHERAAAAMEALYRERLDDHLGELAHHYARSANIEKALEYLGLAGRQAHRRLLHSEAMVHLNAALQLLKSLPEGEERQRREVSLQLSFAEAAAAARGPADDEAGAAFVRARTLCTRLGDTRRLFPALLGLRFFYDFKSQWQNDLETSQQLLALAEREPSPVRLLWAHFVLGQSLLRHGRHREARAHIEKAIALIPAIAERAVFRVADPRPEAPSTLSQVLWFLGFPDQAVERIREALALAKKLGKPYPLCSVYNGACVLHGYRGDIAAVEEAANALSLLADERGFGLWSAYGTYWRGWCLIQKGSVEEGLEELQLGVAGQRAVGSAGVGWGLFNAYHKLRRFEEELALLNEATWPPVWSSHMRRVRGELQLDLGRCSEREAEDHFREAIRIARRQEARSLELLAATSLARLLAKQDRRGEARTMLAEIYGWFTEGFDTADLKDAKALLEQL